MSTEIRERIHGHLMKHPCLTVNEIGRALRMTNGSGKVNARQVSGYLQRMQRDGEVACLQAIRPGQGSKIVYEWIAL